MDENLQLNFPIFRPLGRKLRYNSLFSVRENLLVSISFRPQKT